MAAPVIHRVRCTSVTSGFCSPSSARDGSPGQWRRASGRMGLVPALRLKLRTNGAARGLRRPWPPAAGPSLKAPKNPLQLGASCWHFRHKGQAHQRAAPNAAARCGRWRRLSAYGLTTTAEQAGRNDPLLVRSKRIVHDRNNRHDRSAPPPAANSDKTHLN